MRMEGILVCMPFFHILLGIVCPDFDALLPGKWTNFDRIREKMEEIIYVYDQQGNF